MLEQHGNMVRNGGKYPYRCCAYDPFDNLINKSHRETVNERFVLKGVRLWVLRERERVRESDTNVGLAWMSGWRNGEKRKGMRFEVIW